jgi:aryl sulfotransferase
MGKIIWLASYPKSGNTWVRVLLTNYMRNGNEPVDINKLDGGPIASARLWFDEWAGIEASALDDNVIERLRPDVYRRMAGESQQTLFMKVHDAWTLTDRNEAMFPPDVTAGVVYILRNPLDIAMSFAHHWGVTVAKAVENMCDPEYTIARSLGGLSDQLRQRLLSWSGHVQSWLDKSRLSIYTVRYEDLLRNPEIMFREIVNFCGLPYDETRINKAVAFSNFSELQRQEKEKGFRERSVVAPGPFFRRGQAGSWREELNEELASHIISRHKEIMHRFGYLTDAGQIVF